MFRTLSRYALLAVVAGLLGCPNGLQRPVTVGMILSLTGDLSTAGLSAQAAVRLALQDIAADPSMPAIALDTRDSKGDPRTALNELMDLKKTSAPQVVIGPISSSEVQNTRLYAERNDMLVISPSSTASSLAIPGDTTYRMVPDDSNQAKAIALLIRSQGYGRIAILYRNDAYGVSFADDLQSRFIDHVIARVEYSVATTNFAPVVADLAAAVTDAQQVENAEPVAVIILAFDESSAAFTAASAQPVLATVPWYCTESIQALDAAASAFAVTVHLTGTDFSSGQVENSAEYDRVFDALTETLGFPPTLNSLIVYDTVWTIALAYRDLPLCANFQDLTGAFIASAQNYSGIMGPAVLNDAGDRFTISYDYGEFKEISPGVMNWVRVAMYQGLSNTDGTIIWLDSAR